MTKLILSTGNIMKGGPSIIGRSATEKSNTELTNSLRANFLASHQACSLESEDQTLAINGSKSNGLLELDPPKWTSREPGVIYVPAVDFSASGLVEERSQYDITVKLFFLPSTKISARSAHTGEAIFLVLKELHVKSIDLLIVSFAGITFDADDDEDEEVDNNSGQESENLDDIMQTWKTMEQLHAAGTVSQIGLAEFGSERLKKFLPRTKVRPSVDQINVRDCCVVPKSLILYAKQEKIELLTHNDCTNILPKGTVRELLSGGQAGARLLADPVTGSQGLQGEVEPQWVVKYTAVVRDRGVIENKGYFAMAKING